MGMLRDAERALWTLSQKLRGRQRTREIQREREREREREAKARCIPRRLQRGWRIAREGSSRRLAVQSRGDGAPLLMSTILGGTSC